VAAIAAVIGAAIAGGDLLHGCAALVPQEYVGTEFADASSSACLSQERQE